MTDAPFPAEAIISAVRGGCHLPMNQLAILLLVSQASTPLSVKHIGARLNLSPPNASRSLDALNRRGLIVRGQNPVDRRLLNARCTEDGLVFLGQLDALMRPEAA